jgi:hypothetical protein
LGVPYAINPRWCGTELIQPYGVWWITERLGRKARSVLVAVTMLGRCRAASLAGHSLPWANASWS